MPLRVLRINKASRTMMEISLRLILYHSIERYVLFYKYNVNKPNQKFQQYVTIILPSTKS